MSLFLFLLSSTVYQQRPAPRILTFFRRPQIAFAMRIFFPPKEDKSARQEAKKRLRMILVADRCTLPVSSLSTMKTEIVKAVSQFVEVEGEETVDVNLTRDDSMGTVRSILRGFAAHSAVVDACLENCAPQSA